MSCQANSTTLREPCQPRSLSSATFGRQWRKLQLAPTSTHGNDVAEHIPAELLTCPMVWIRQDGNRQPLTPRYDGPFQVVERHQKFFRIKMGEREDTVSINRLKPAAVPEGTGPAEPKKRGRPQKDMATEETKREGATQGSSGPQQEATTRSS